MKNTTKFLRSKSLMDVACTAMWNSAWRALRSAKTWDVTVRVPEYPKLECVPQTTFQYDFRTGECFMRGNEPEAMWVPMGKVENATCKGAQ